MNTFRAILFAAREGLDQLAAFERAVLLARANQARLTLVDVVSPASPADRDEEQALALERLRALAAPHQDEVEIRLEVLQGREFLEIVRAVLRDSHDLVIKVAQDEGPLESLFGSNDMHLLRKCPCPVWIMKPHEEGGYASIVAALDLDPMDADSREQQELNAKILKLSGALALEHSAPLRLVHAWQALGERKLLFRGHMHGTAAFVQSEQAARKKLLLAQLETLRELFGPEAYRALAPRCHLPHGPAQRMIPMVAAELRADVVVMGTVARTGIPGFIIGNTAESILSRLRCSVLAVKPSGFATPVRQEG